MQSAVGPELKCPIFLSWWKLEKNTCRWKDLQLKDLQRELKQLHEQNVHLMKQTGFECWTQSTGPNFFQLITNQ